MNTCGRSPKGQAEKARGNKWWPLGTRKRVSCGSYPDRRVSAEPIYTAHQSGARVSRTSAARGSTIRMSAEVLENKSCSTFARAACEAHFLVLVKLVHGRTPCLARELRVWPATRSKRFFATLSWNPDKSAVVNEGCRLVNGLV